MVKGATAAASSSAAGSKRKSCAKQPDVRVAKLNEEYQQLDEVFEQEEMDIRIALIVAELNKSPHKVTRCLRAVRGTQFDVGRSSTTNEDKEDRFPDTASYLCKVPRLHLETMSKTAKNDLNRDFWKPLVKADVTALHKCLYRVSLTDQSSCIPSRVKTTFDEVVRDRMTQAETSWDMITFDHDTNQIDWQASGVYIFHPVVPMSERGSEETVTVYTSLQFNKCERLDLSGSELRVTSKWHIKFNWSIKRALLCSPEGDAISVQKLCSDLFKDRDDMPKFKDLFSTHLLTGLADEEDAAEAVEEAPDVVAPLALRRSLSASQLKKIADLKTSG